MAESVIPPPTPMTPYVCMTCGHSQSQAPGWGIPYCLNHGAGFGVPMLAWPLPKLRALLTAPTTERIKP